jgi:hypothetical protein
VAGGVDHVDNDVATVVVLLRVNTVVKHSGVLREDRDALFALELVGVHGAVFEVRVRVEGVGLAKHCVDKSGLAVVNVCDDRHVAQVVASGDSHASSPWWGVRVSHMSSARLFQAAARQRSTLGEGVF